MICRLPRLPAGNLFISEAITSWFLKRLICHSRKRVTIFSAFFVKSTGWKCSQESLRCCARIVFYDKVDLTLGADAGLSPPLRMRNRTFYGISLGWPHPNLQCLLGLKNNRGCRSDLFFHVLPRMAKLYGKIMEHHLHVEESWGHVESHFCKPLENPGNIAPSHHIHPNHRHIWGLLNAAQPVCLSC